MIKTIKQSIKIEIEAKDFGFYWSDHSQITKNIIDEIHEIEECLEKNFSQTELQQELGDLLFASLSLCFFLDVCPQLIYKNTLHKVEHSWLSYSAIIDNLVNNTIKITKYLDCRTSLHILQEELSNTLFLIISLCTYLHFNPEETLVKANKKIETRLSNTILNAQKAGFTSLQGQSDDVKMRFWHQAKANEKCSLIIEN